ncbi:MAG: lysophospholipid acyltransferase family protein [Nitrospinota bacterium]|nr:lysophospholipid acyltransferase family protein [Nitrospinota bacterium]
MKKKKNIVIELLLYIPVWAIFEFTRISPRSFGYALWKSIALLLWPITKRRRGIMRENLRPVFPGKSDDEFEKIGLDVYLNLGRVYAEFCKIGALNQENVNEFVTFEGLEHLDAALAKGKGVIIPTMHYYNAELINGALAVKGYPVHWVIREVDNFFLDRKMDAIRTGSGMKVIKKERALREMLARIREGKIVSVTVDQKASFNEVWIRFLGRWSATVKAPAVISLRTGAAIVPMFSVPQLDNTHKVSFLPAISYEPTGETSVDVFNLSTIVSDLQSEFIKKHPGVWFWLHRKWSIVPTEKIVKECEALEKRFIESGYGADLSSVI